MKYTENNVVVDNVLTQFEIEQIYEAVKNNNGEDFVEPHCQLNKFIRLPEEIIEKFTQHARKISGNNNLVLTEYCYSIYKNKKDNNGKNLLPSLFPHYDETFKEPRFTFDYQLRSTIDWPLFVEPDKEFILKDNQALTFSGTHQIHWRTPVVFNDDDYIEMIFCHFSDPSSGPKEDDVNDIMNAKAKHYRDIFFNDGGFSNVDKGGF